jgi:hypothetical protein
MLSLSRSSPFARGLVKMALAIAFAASTASFVTLAGGICCRECSSGAYTICCTYGDDCYGCTSGTNSCVAFCPNGEYWTFCLD